MNTATIEKIYIWKLKISKFIGFKKHLVLILKWKHTFMFLWKLLLTLVWWMACVKYFQRERTEIRKNKTTNAKDNEWFLEKEKGKRSRVGAKRNPLKRISKETFLLLTICQQKICYGHYDNPLLRKAKHIIFIQSLYLVQTVTSMQKVSRYRQWGWLGAVFPTNLHFVIAIITSHTFCMKCYVDR